MIENADKILAGAYYQHDGTLIIPIEHRETGERIGEQQRHDDGTVRYTRGIRMREAAPLIFKPIDQRASALIIVEGPTDAIALAGTDLAQSATIIGCWSAGTIPPREWWQAYQCHIGSIFTCGDGDPAGNAFNQKIADIFGEVFAVKMPRGLDVRDILETKGTAYFAGMLNIAQYSKPLTRRKQYYEPREFQPITGIDITQLVESCGAKLRSKMTSGQLKYLCPLHEDRSNPSLTVDPETGSWKCWSGCGQGGPVQFVMALKQCSYRDALSFIEGLKYR